MSQNREQIQLYNLSQFKAFAGDNHESLRQILVVFISSGLKNAAFFRQSIQEENRDAVSELAHKMLPVFRQLQASDLVSLLSQLERKDLENTTPDLYFLIGKMALEKMEEILKVLQEEENIRMD